MRQDGTHNPPRPEVSAALATATQDHLPAPADSLAEMAQRDLDAALQLLADRAQYITGASGAAIALRREGQNDLLCRATTGENAPELGALFSTEWGLSGESVRTRQALRCDDAECDARVNREVCREMGIASVVVMPVVNDDEVLGVFELFSAKANAFGARDLSAVERLSVMVETAVRLASASQNLVPRKTEAQEADERTLDGAVENDLVLEGAESVVEMAATEPSAGAEVPVEQEGLTAGLEAPSHAEKDGAGKMLGASAVDAPTVGQPPAETLRVDTPAVDTPVIDAPAVDAAPVVDASPETAAPKKALFWSAAVSSGSEAATSERADESRVPPMLRSLRKCTACGFPVSAGRVLCVECEEKKWRGQPLLPKPGIGRTLAVSAAKAESGKAGLARTELTKGESGRTESARTESGKTEARAFAAAAGLRSATAGLGPSVAAESKSRPADAAMVASARAAERPRTNPTPEFVLSAGLAPEQSWLSRNRYIVGVLLAVIAAACAVFFLR